MRLLAIVLLALSVGVACNETAFPTESKRPAICQTAFCCPQCEMTTVSGIVDGDTFESPQGTVRLFGVDAPEIGQPCYDEATARLRRLAAASARVEQGPRARDSYGRLLYYVYTESGQSIDDTLIREGLGRAWTKDGQHAEALIVREEEGRQSHVGCLWK